LQSFLLTEEIRPNGGLKKEKTERFITTSFPKSLMRLSLTQPSFSTQGSQGYWGFGFLSHVPQLNKNPLNLFLSQFNLKFGI